MAKGRFAPSPTGDLHLGNLRTALLAWLFARSAGSAFLVRMEDLDRTTSSRAHEAAQLRDLAALGLDWDPPVVRQSERFDRYREAIARLTAAGLTYPCYCTRREIREASSAPHGDGPGGPAAGADGRYPGTCRELTAGQRAAREAEGRPPAIRLRTDGPVVGFTDRLHGPVRGVVDDVVLARNDGVPAYNLAVVVDDAQQGVEEVVRGDDLLTSTPRQIHLARLLDLPVPRYAHVPLVLGADGTRLAKRHGAVTLADVGADAARLRIADSLGLCTEEERTNGHVGNAALLRRFDPGRLPREPWIVR
jgi:glutamyl-tRNA synthetase